MRIIQKNNKIKINYNKLYKNYTQNPLTKSTLKINTNNLQTQNVI